jgi:hypothetical protein
LLPTLRLVLVLLLLLLCLVLQVMLLLPRIHSNTVPANAVV